MPKITIDFSDEAMLALYILGETAQKEVDGLMEDKIVLASEMRQHDIVKNKTLAELDTMSKEG